MNGTGTAGDDRVAVVVLAAGLGQRVAAASQGRPKWLLPVNGATIAERQLAGFAELGSLVSRRTAVTGAGAEHIGPFAQQAAVGTLHNPLHAQYNNWYSALLALEAAEESEVLVLVNADLCADPILFSGFVRDALGSGADAAIAADFDRELTDEAMKMSRSPGGDPPRLAAIGKVDVDQPVAEYPGLLALRGDRIRGLATTLRGFADDPSCHNNWYEHAIQAELRAGRPWTMIPVRTTAWVEIDTPDDLDDAAARLAHT